MIDLSNNNGGVIDFHRLYKAGQRRVYLKCSEGANFVDKDYKARKNDALAAKFKVGAYHFARPHSYQASVEFAFFSSLVGPLVKGKILRPMLDLEDGAPDNLVRNWVNEFVSLFVKKYRFRPLIYGNYPYLSALHFPSKPGPLGLAGYGRNDGKEYPFQVPKPWNSATAHQYASTKVMPGVQGECDIWHVYSFANLELPK